MPWGIRTLGVGAPVTAIVLALAPAHAVAVDASQILSVARRASVGAAGGQCKVFANTVVASASKGRIALSKYHDGFREAGAVEVPLELAGPGDIIQVIPAGSTDATAETFWRRGGPLHTAVVERNLGGLRYAVIDSNWAGNERIARRTWEPVEWADSKGGGIIKAWRFGRGGTVARSALGDGSFVRVAGTSGIYRIAGAAPLPVLTPTAVGGVRSITEIDYPTLNNLAPFPVDGTILRSGPGGRLYRVTDGVPRILPVTFRPDRPPVVIDPAAIANAGGPGAFSRLRNVAFSARGALTRLRVVSAPARVRRGPTAVVRMSVAGPGGVRPVGRCSLQRRRGKRWIAAGSANLTAAGTCAVRVRIGAATLLRGRFLGSTGWRPATGPGFRIRLR
ncbi:MAG: hypothetical protein RJQ03_00385 [Miltoncostaeaceae bacterium]